MSMIYDDYPSNYEGGVSIGGYPVGGRARMHRKRGGMPVGGAITSKVMKQGQLYRANIEMLKKLNDNPTRIYKLIVAEHMDVYGKKPTQKQVHDFINKNKANIKTIDTSSIELGRVKSLGSKKAKKQMKQEIVSAPAKKGTRARKALKRPRGVSVPKLQQRVSGLSMKDRHELANWLHMKGAGQEDTCPACNGSGILSGLLSSFGLGADMEGSGWADDLWSGVKQGVDIGTKILPFVL